jgi:lactate dehydrogenase-like 2-hydroxyacid dehydrogenase
LKRRTKKVFEDKVERQRSNHPSARRQPAPPARKKLYRKVVVLDSVIFFPEHRARLTELADEVVEYNTCTSEDEVSERCRGADCIISCWINISHRIIEENPQLRTIAFWTHDYEHRIDAAFARERGIHVPAIPDYGTDSVAELVFIALLNMYGGATGQDAAEHIGESVVAKIGDDVRRFSRNNKDTLDGRWLHEYIKTGRRQMTCPDEIPEETLKGLTVGVLDRDILDEPLVRALAHGFRMNLTSSLTDHAHSLDVAFRPIDELLAESRVLVYNDASLPAQYRSAVDSRSYLSKVDVADVSPVRRSLRGRTLGIVGLGRIGGRVAQIARAGFGMNVQYATRTPKPELDRGLGLRAANLDEVLTTSDIVTFHLPHHGAENFVTADMIRKIPDGTTVLNVSVGNVIEDESLLLKRFAAGELRGYLDVYRTLPPRAELRAIRDSLTATYRLGWRTKSTVGLKTHKLLTKIAAVPPVSEASR